MESEPALASLPDELLALLFIYLSQTDIHCSSRTCKAWRDATALTRLRNKRRFFAIYHRNDSIKHFERWFIQGKWLALEDGIRFQITAKQATKLARCFLEYTNVWKMLWPSVNETDYHVQLLRLLMTRGFTPHPRVGWEGQLCV